MLEGIVAEAVAPDAAREANADAPVGEGDGGIGAHAAAVHFELRGEAVLAGAGPRVHPAERIDVGIADDDDGGGGWAMRGQGGSGPGRQRKHPREYGRE